MVGIGFLLLFSVLSKTTKNYGEIMKCKKTCKCSECEMAQMSDIVAIDDRHPFNEKRYFIPMGWCIQYGTLGENTTQLKNGRFTSDILYYSERGEIVLELIENFKNGHYIDRII